ncbi:MAG TPA: FtsX-like permease family protein, partial [Gemmata sp.]|nr:FtsX-like permease family protein [Gemmata sp.]
MYEALPPEAMWGFSTDTAVLRLSLYMLGGLFALNGLAIGLGVVTLPVFFLIVYLLELPLKAGAAAGFTIFKVALLILRGLRRAPLRTALTYLALFVLTFVLCFIYAILALVDNKLTDKEKNFRAIMTEKYTVPSQMPRGYVDKLTDLAMSLPEGERPVNGPDDVMSWSFFFGTTDPKTNRPENAMFMFGLDPMRVLNIDKEGKYYSVLDDELVEGLSDTDRDLVYAACLQMREEPRKIVLSQSRLEAMGLQVGQKIKVYSPLMYKDIQFEFEICAVLPKGKFEGLGFMNSLYLFRALESYRDDIRYFDTSAMEWKSKAAGVEHPLANKCVNLIWIRLPNKVGFQKLAGMVDDPKNFSNPVAAKMETESAGIGSFMDSFKDMFALMRYFISPAMIVMMSLIVANAIGIAVRERRTELAVLKVLGFRPWHVMAFILGEGLLIGFLGGALSSSIAYFWLEQVKFQIAFLG